MLLRVASSRSLLFLQIRPPARLPTDWIREPTTPSEPPPHRPHLTAPGLSRTATGDRPPALFDDLSFGLLPGASLRRVRTLTAVAVPIATR